MDQCFLGDHLSDHQSTMIEVERNISNTIISILIDFRSSLSYISPQIIEKCKSHKDKQKKRWLVQLATGTKRKIKELVKELVWTGWKLIM